jgi:hypothetical protein
MASTLYPIFKRKLLEGSTTVDLINGGDTIKVALVADEDHTYSALDDFLDDVSADFYLASTPQTLANQAVAVYPAAGSALYATFNADDITYTALDADGTKDIDALIVYQDTGTPATSELIAYIEVTEVRPNGGDITVTWENGDATYNDFIFAI